MNLVPNETFKLYRRRLIPQEYRLLKDDVIVRLDENHLITTWNTLNPKTAFCRGSSCYFLKEGFKVSKIYRQDGSLLYWYCDIVEYTQDPGNNALTVTDLLADYLYKGRFDRLTSVLEDLGL